MTARPSILAWLSAGLLAASCALPSTDEFSRGGPMSPEAGASDGTTQLPIVDGSTVLPDGAVVTDASTKADVSTTLCAGHAFCSTFDSPASLNDFPDETHTEGGGTVVVEGGMLHASVPPRPGDKPRNAIITREVSQNARRAIIELDLQVDHGDYTGLTGNAAILSVDLIATKYSNLALYVGDTHSEAVPLRDDGNFESDSTSPNIPRSQLLHVRLEIDFDPTNGSYTLSFDGKVAASRKGFAFGNPGNGRLRVQLGIQSPNPPTPSFDVVYDNLVVDLP
ncbi:MAG: hypothetical protein U0270_05265 [Labilithrix sp.]